MLSRLSLFWNFIIKMPSVVFNWNNSDAVRGSAEPSRGRQFDSVPPGTLRQGRVKCFWKDLEAWLVGGRMPHTGYSQGPELKEMLFVSRAGQTLVGFCSSVTAVCSVNEVRKKPKGNWANLSQQWILSFLGQQLFTLPISKPSYSLKMLQTQSAFMYVN